MNRPKPLLLRKKAEQDVNVAIAYYVAQDAREAALGFIDALERLSVRLRRNPNIGSPRYAHELGIAGLRCAALKRYPYLVFYVELGDRIEVWRILHAHRDIPASLVEA